MHAYIRVYIYIYIYAHTYIHVFLFRRIFSLPAIVAMAMCAFVDQLGQRCQTRARPSDRNWPVAERRCAFCSQVEEDARRVNPVEVMGAACPAGVDAPDDQDSPKRRNKSASIGFEGQKNTWYLQLPLLVQGDQRHQLLQRSLESWI